MLEGSVGRGRTRLLGSLILERAERAGEGGVGVG